MVGKTKLVDATTLKIAQAGLKSLGRYGVIASKLRAIISAGEYGVAPVARVYGIARSTLTDWIKNLKDDKSLLKLQVSSGRGRKSKLSKEQCEIVEQWLLLEPGLTIDKVVARIKESFNMDLGRSTVHRLMKKLSYSYITPRPIHYKQDKSLHDEFKKKDQHKA
jgi:transposase